jgi:hypothetical protein
MDNTTDFLKPPKFVEFSCTAKSGRYGGCTKLGGIGNTLVLFPAAYLLAMVSGRHLILNDHSAMGAWCRALNCSFPFTSEVEKQFPEFKLKKVKRVSSLNHIDVIHRMRENISISDHVIGFHGMDVFSTNWYTFSGPVVKQCVANITG